MLLIVLVVFRGATESEWAKDAEEFESSSVVSRGACIGDEVFLVVCVLWWWVCENGLSLCLYWIPWTQNKRWRVSLSRQLFKYWLLSWWDEKKKRQKKNPRTEQGREYSYSQGCSQQGEHTRYFALSLLHGRQFLRCLVCPSWHSLCKVVYAEMCRPACKGKANGLQQNLANIPGN